MLYWFPGKGNQHLFFELLMRIELTTFPPRRDALLVSRQRQSTSLF
jgi:hypothetical protein